MTKNNVEYNLEVSPYVATVVYYNKFTVEYFFSSQPHKEKFLKKILSFREEMKIKTEKRYKVSVCLLPLYDILLYDKIETRGFRIKNKAGEYRCLQEIKLSGELRMLHN